MPGVTSRMWYTVGSSNLAGSGPKVWNWGTAGAGAGWWETSEALGEGASVGGGCECVGYSTSLLLPVWTSTPS